MKNQEILHKEIDLIQNIISRMASNSFLLKGWLISLIALIFALSKDAIIIASIIMLLVTVVFWYLDAFFLHKEKCYRKLYDWVIENRKNTDEYLYNLDYIRFEKQGKSVFFIMCSKTLFTFYGLIVFILTGLIIYNSI